MRVRLLGLYKKARKNMKVAGALGAVESKVLWRVRCFREK